MSDLISREMTIDTLHDKAPDQEGVDDLIAIIKEIPSVNPQSKTGHWIEHPHEAGPCWEYSRYECSECHEWAEDDSDYCPDCGARMAESEDKDAYSN